MTKRPRQPNRTHALDRDGDGQPGGSLPGNQTAPYAGQKVDTVAVDEAQDLPLTPTAQDQVDEAASLENMERETSDANAAVRAAAGWTRDDARLIQKLEDIGARLPEGHNLSRGEVVEAWTDQEAFNVEAFADAMAAEGRYTSADGEEFNADGSAIDLPLVLGIWDIDFDPGHVIGDTSEDGWQRHNQMTLDDLDMVALTIVGRESGATVETIAAWSDDDVRAADAWLEKTLQGFAGPGFKIEPWPGHLAPFLSDTAETAATFTAEEIASGHAPVSQEDEAEAIAAELGVVIDPEDPIITVNTPTAPVAVRVRELQRLVDNRWLYKTPDGFSPNTHPPYIEAETAQVWVAAGLAQWEPTAGNHGGIRVTAEARSLLVRKPEAV